MTAEAFTELVLEVFRLNGELLAEGDRLCAPHGQTSARWQVLGALASGPETASGVAVQMGLTRQSVQRTIDLLLEEGLCESIPNPRHKRALLIRLTKKGERILEKITGEQLQWATKHAKPLSESDLRKAINLLREIREGFSA